MSTRTRITNHADDFGELPKPRTALCEYHRKGRRSTKLYQTATADDPCVYCEAEDRHQAAGLGLFDPMSVER